MRRPGGRRVAWCAMLAATPALLACGKRDVVAVYLGEALPSACESEPCDGGALDATDYAWCACDDLLATAMLTLQGDATDAPASLAARGGLHLEAPLAVDGTLVVGPDRDLTGTAVGTLAVGIDLWIDGDLAGEISVDVGGDAYVAGDVRVRELRVGGVLTLPEGRELSATDVLAHGAVRRAPVDLAAPCACDTASTSPAAARLDAARDSASLVRLDDAAYAGFTGSASLALGCGEHWVAALVGDGDLAITVDALATLYVDGPINLAGSLDLSLAPGASLVLVVAGDVRAGGEARLGSPDAPERIELVTDGSQLRFERGGTLHGTVNAPAAELLVEGPLRMRGNLRAKRVVVDAELMSTFVSLDPLTASCR